MADAAADAGLELAPMPNDAQSALKALIPFCAPRNPIDITGQVFHQKDAVDAFVTHMFEKGDYATVVAFFSYIASIPSMLAPIREALRRAHKRHPDALLVLSMVGPDDIAESYEAEGVPVFEEPVRAVRVVGALAKVGEGLSKPTIDPEQESHRDGKALTTERLDEHQAKGLLKSWGIPCVEGRVATNAEEAARMADALGYPVAVKLLSPDITHKSDIGGVRLALDSAHAVAEAHRSITNQATAEYSHADIRGTLISPMMAGQLEMILGVQHDPTFGPIILVGLGGVFTETLGDDVFRRVPIARTEARRMLTELRGSSLLWGARGTEAVDVDALCDSIAALSQFAHAHHALIESVDINPLLVMTAGNGVWALDALIAQRQG